MKKPREQDTVKAIVDYLQMRGCLAWRMNTGAFKAEHAGKTRFHRFGVRGMSDIIGIAPWKAWRCDDKRCIKELGGEHPHFTTEGRFLAIEVKSATGKPTPEQVAFLSAVVKAGGIAFIARTLDDVREHGL